MAYGNISSYVAAGKSVSGAGSQLFGTQRSRTDTDQILKAALQAQAEEKLNVMQIKGKLDQAAINVKSNLASQAIQTEADTRVSAIKGKTQKMAGVVASLAPVANMFKNKRKRPKAPVNVDYSELLAESNTRLTQAQEDLANFKPTTMDTPPAQISEAPSQNGSSSYDLSKLTDKDWNDLAYVVSGEAARGTKDEYGVAASVLNRVSSGKFPNTIGAVINAPGQYAAIQDGGARHEPGLVASLSSETGRAEIIKALGTLGGRTDFKGQALLRNRHPDEDPMFHPKGNFYHFPGQT